MRRRTAIGAKIVWGRHDPLAEMTQPDMIYGHSGSQRVFATRKPFGKGQPPARAGFGEIVGGARFVSGSEFFLQSGLGLAESLFSFGIQLFHAVGNFSGLNQASL